MTAEQTTFCAPLSVEDALAEIAGGDATVLAGGTSVALMVGQGLLRPSKLVMVTRVPQLRSVTVDPDRREVRIGAAVTLRELARHPDLSAWYPALALAASSVGNPRVRSVATVGGSVVHADPRQDVPPVLLALGAEVVVGGQAGPRRTPLAGFATGFMETVLGPDELVTEVVLPVVAGRRSHYARFTPQSAADYPTVGVAATVQLDAEGTVAGASVALGGVGPTAIVVHDAATLAGVRGSDVRAAVGEVARKAAGAAAPVDDRLGSAAYKRAMVSVWTERSLLACLEP